MRFNRSRRGRRSRFSRRPSRGRSMRRGVIRAIRGAIARRIGRRM